MQILLNICRKTFFLLKWWLHQTDKNKTKLWLGKKYYFPQASGFDLNESVWDLEDCTKRKGLFKRCLIQHNTHAWGGQHLFPPLSTFFCSSSDVH